jgi:hypothetical protein
MIMLKDVWKQCGAEIERKKLGKLDFLWYLSWLKVYATWDVMAVVWGVHKSTFMRRVNEVLYILNERLKEVRKRAKSKNSLFCSSTTFVDDRIHI